MAYRDEEAALSQRLADLEARLAGMRKSKAALESALAEEASVVQELDALRKRAAPSAAELKKRLPLVQQLTIAAPCPVAWDSMRGDDKVRFCDQCQKNVFNVSAMTTAESEKLLRDTRGELCVQLYRRADGTVLTQDCPVGLRARKRRRLVALAAAGAVTAAGALALLSGLRQVRGGVPPLPQYERTAGAVPPQQVPVQVEQPSVPVMGGGAAALPEPLLREGGAPMVVRPPAPPHAARGHRRLR